MKSLNTALMLFIAGLVLGGCTSQAPRPSQPEKAALTQQQVCSELKTLFIESQNGFRDIRQKPEFHNKITLWQTTHQPLNGHCEIWQWSNRYSYVCSRVVPDQQAATDIFDASSHRIQKCLPDDWQSRRVVLPDSKGEKIEYLRNGQVRGSFQKVKSEGLFASDWTIYVLISSPEG